MVYRSLGRTGISVSSLGFGCMRLPMVNVNGKEAIDQDKVDAMLAEAFALGVNYYDTAYFYNDGQSEIAVGRAVKRFREKIVVSTKSPGHLLKKPGDYRLILEEQLRKLDMDHIDIYYFHGIGYDNFLATDRQCGWLAEAFKAHDEGLIRHIGFSFHDKPEAMMKLADLGHFETVLCQYSAVDRSNETAIAYVKAKGLGVTVMGPLGGGRVSGLPKAVAERLGLKVASSVELALRFVFANADVDCALSGMGNIDMVRENAAVSRQRQGLSPVEVEALNALMAENARLAELYCTGCGYCQPCPADVNIPEIFRMMNYYRIYGIADYAKRGYAEIGTNEWVRGKRADACTACGVCEAKCPQKIMIRAQLAECRAALA